MNASPPLNTPTPPPPPAAEEPCPIPRWQGSPQQEIEIIRAALARYRQLMHQADQAEQAARQNIAQTLQRLGLPVGAGIQRLEDRLIDAEIAVAMTQGGAL